MAPLFIRIRDVHPVTNGFCAYTDSYSFRGFEATRLVPELSERGHCGAIQGSTGWCELGTMARTIPALFERIPVDDTAHMRAARRVCMQMSLLITADGDLFQPAAE